MLKTQICVTRPQCVKQGMDWDEINFRGLPSKSINIIKEGYEDFRCRVLHEGQLSDSIKTSSGVRQGCHLSPLLFLLVMDGVLRGALDGKKRELTWRLQASLEDMDYTDDVCLYLINMSICKGNWMTSGRNPRRLALKLIPQRQKIYALIQ